MRPIFGSLGGIVAVGLFRIKNGWIGEDSIRVRYDDGVELEIPASNYVLNDFLPQISKLPLREDDSRKATKPENI